MQLGRYELLFRIAAGGMAEVYAGRVRGEAGFEKLVAVKRMLPHLAEDPRFVDMFLDEGRVAASVASPHVVQTLDLGRADDGSLYLVLELCIGASLAQLLRALELRGERVPLSFATEILAQAAQGLDDAHEATTPAGMHLDIVHRDVSPHNLLVGTDGRTRVADFGIARALLRRTHTSTGELKGKFGYFAPEQVRGLEVDRRSDLFSLGVVAWETLTGARLFAGDDPMRILRRITDEPIPDPRSLRPEVPAPLAAVVLRALARDPAQRWQTAGDLAAAMRRAGTELGVVPSARAIGRWVKATASDRITALEQGIRGALEEPIELDVDPDAPTTTTAGARRPAPAGAPPGAGSGATQRPGNDAPLATSTATGVETFDPEKLGRSRARTRTVALGAVALGGLAAVFAMGRVTAEVDAASSGSAVPPVAPSFSAVPAASASASPSSDAKPRPLGGPLPPRPLGGPLPGRGPAAPASLPAPPPPPEPAAAPPPPPPAPAPAPPPAKPTGPLLGDDAFSRDATRAR